MHLVFYVLENSSFTSVDNTNENSHAIVDDHLLVLKSNGYEILEKYFQRSDYIEHFKAYQFNKNYGTTLRCADLCDFDQSEFDLQGALS